MPPQEERPVQKKGRDARKPFIFSTPLIVLFLVLAYLAWNMNREPPLREISYGSLMQILKAEDPGVRFQNVAVRHKSDVRGEMVVTDSVSDGTLTPEHASEVKPFRARIGLDSDADLLKRLEERVGSGVVADVEDGFVRVVQQMF